MKKHTSKLIALVLALCLCLSLSVSAFAAEIDSSGGSGSTPVNLSSTSVPSEVITSCRQQFEAVLRHTQRNSIEILPLCQLQDETFGKSSCANAGRLQHLHRKQSLLQQ